MESFGMSNLVPDQISKVKRLMHLHVQYSQFTGNAVTDVSASCSVSLKTAMLLNFLPNLNSHALQCSVSSRFSWKLEQAREP